MTSSNAESPHPGRLSPKPQIPINLDDPQFQGTLDHTLITVERAEILRALSRAGGRRSAAARILGITRSRLYRRIEALGIVFEEPGKKGSA
jgi:transcriptional regulator of acetoin/glycerol metabolism